MFAPARIAVLKLLASQAAIALENTRLYRDGVEREAKIRRLVDANIIGIFICGCRWRSSSRLTTHFCAWWDTIARISPQVALRWTDLTPPEWRDASCSSSAASELRR